MIRTFALCPFCAEGAVAFDDHLEIVFNPDSTKHIACDHLAFFWVCLSGESNWNWGRFWGREQGLGETDSRDLLTELVTELTCDLLLPEYQPRAAYQVAGTILEDFGEETEFLVYPPAASPEFVIFDARAVYAYDAAALVADMNDKVRMIRASGKGRNCVVPRCWTRSAKGRWQ